MSDNENYCNKSIHTQNIQITTLDNVQADVNWYTSSGAWELANKSLISYEEYVRRSEIEGQIDEVDERQISLDVPRAVSSLHKYVLGSEISNQDINLRKDPVEKPMELLRRILKAYCVRNPRIGYVQGHGDVVSFLLGMLNCHEEEVFWVYCILVERIFPADFFSSTPKLQGFHVDMAVFEKLVLIEKDKVISGLSDNDVASVSSLLAFKWFVSIWVGEIPREALFYIWDQMLTTDIGPILHFYAALAILKYTQEEMLLSITDEDNEKDPSFAYKSILEAAKKINNMPHLIEKAKEIFKLSEEKIEEMREQVRSKPQFIEEEISALSGITHFNRSQLEKLQLEFRVLKESARKRDQKVLRGIDKEALRQILSRVIPEWPQRHCDQLFEILQPDALGNIDFQRLILIFSVLFKGTLEEKLKLCFDLYDTSKTGYLGIEDMMRMASSLGEIYHYRLGTRDSTDSNQFTQSSSRQRPRSASTGVYDPRSGNKTILYDQYGQVLSTTFINKLLSMDRSGAKKITFEEWMQGAMTEPYILRCFVVNMPKSTIDTMSTIFSSASHRRSRSSDLSHLPADVAITSDISGLVHSHRTSCAKILKIEEEKNISLLSPNASHRLLHENQLHGSSLKMNEKEADTDYHPISDTNAVKQEKVVRSICHPCSVL